MNTQNRLLTVCPTRNRPERLKTLIDSFEKTIRGESVLLILLDKCDIKLGEYVKVVKDHDVLIQPRQTLTKIINSAFEKYPDFGYYSIVNDDMEYITPGWDTILRSDGIAYGNFRVNNVNPMSSVINGDLVRAVGWIQYPKLISLSGDNIWYWIGKRLNRLYRYWDVFIEHHHPYFDKHEWDKSYDESNSSERYARDWAEVTDWLRHRSPEDLELIRRRLNCK